MKMTTIAGLLLTAAVSSAVQYQVVILPSLGAHMRAESVWGGSIAGHTDQAPEIPIAWLWNSFAPIRLSNSSGLALATSGGTFGGYLRSGPIYNTYRAVMWRMQGARPVETVLHPSSGFDGDSWVFGMDENSQVGSGTFYEPGWSTSGAHAFLWHGSPESLINLHPVNSSFRTSVAVDVDGDIQVGSANTYYPFTGGETQAMMWRGTAESMVVLHPVGAYYSRAVAVSGTTIAGYVDFGNPRPAVWRVGVSGYTELPINGHRGWLRDTNGSEHVGYVATLLGGHGGGIEYRATVWTGDPPTAVNLHSLLPSGIVQSYAEGIDAQGNIVGRGDTSGNRVAILWKRIGR